MDCFGVVALASSALYSREGNVDESDKPRRNIMQYRSRLFMGMLAALALPTLNHATSVTVPGQRMAPEAIRSINDPTVLMFSSGAIDPTRERLVISQYNLQASTGSDVHVIQFHGKAADYRKALMAHGVQILGFMPKQAYLVRASRSALTALGNDDRIAIRFAGPVEPEWKLSSALLDLDAQVMPFRLPGESSVRQDGLGLELSGYPGESVEALTLAVRKIAPEAIVINASESAHAPVVQLWVRRTQAVALIEQATAIHALAYLAPYFPETLHNSDSVEPIQRNAAGAGQPANTPIWNQGLIGSGQIVAVMDSGLDRNEDWFVGLDQGSGPVVELTDSEAPLPPSIAAVHPDRKVYAYWVQPGATAYDNNQVCTTSPTSYHGTHVSGTVAGDSLTRSTPTDPGYDGDDGMAPNAQILFQDIGNDTSGCLSITDLGLTLEQARNGGAYIHSNSWGAAVGGAYNANSAALDQFSWKFEDHLVLFSAGNSGPGSNTIGAPATAKNALTVGALGHGNSLLAASFSSRGPTDDGRLKPDIQAPGSSIVSARGDTNNSATIETALTSTKSGTSMSTPTVAGAAALMRQYFADGFYPLGSANPADQRQPSGALMKAMLLGGTAVPASFNVPSQTFGWGRVFLDNNLYFDGDSRYTRVWDVPHSGGLSTGETDTYTATVDTGEELRITLVWNDPPSFPSAASNLVNDLDLTVRHVGTNTTWLGNVITSGVSTTGGAADTVNNVEQVILPIPLAGQYEITVNGSSVPGDGQNFSDTQGYALVSSGSAVPDPLQAPTAVTATDQGISGIDLAFTPAIRGSSTFNIYRAIGDCTASAVEFRLIDTSASTTLTDTEVIGGFTYSYVIREVSSDINEGQASLCTSASVATSTAACNLIPDFDQSSVVAGDAVSNDCETTVSWDAASAVCPNGSVSYNIYRDTDPFFTPAAGNRIETGLVGSSYNDTSVTSQTYYYVVRAADAAEAPGDLRVKATPVGNFNMIGTFTDGADNLSLLNLEGPWSVSDNQAASGTLSYRNATDDAVEYVPNTCATLTTPPLELQSGSPALTYSARFDLEPDWDGVVVEISTDGGNNWIDLPPAGGYPGDFNMTGNPPINACGYVTTQGAFNGSSLGSFNDYSSDLSAFAGQTVQIRWVMSTDPGSQDEGFYLDDIEITQASTPAVCGSVSPIIFDDGFED